MSAASVAALQEIAHVDASAARLARRAWTMRDPQGSAHTRVALLEFIREHAPRTYQWTRDCYSPPGVRCIRRLAVDEIIGTHGVEYLGEHCRTGHAVYYCNAGDTYAATVLFRGASMRVGCWGDLVERRAIREANP